MEFPENPNLPEEKPKSGQPPKYEPKRVVHRPMPAARQPQDRERKPAFSFFKRKPKPAAAGQTRPVTATRHQSASVMRSAPPADLKPETPPQAASQPPAPPRDESRPTPPPAAISSGRGFNPGLKLRAVEAASRNAPPVGIPPVAQPKRPLIDGGLARRAAWDVASALSLVVNAILVGALLVMAFQIRNLKTTVNGLLGGLYGNFVKMDEASITTNITVQAQIPVSFDLPVSQNTDVILTQSVPIPGANVVINTGIFTMNAPANVTLPAGTSLPIALNMTIPVQTTIPITLQVPVNIPLNQTDLHAPFTGLQKTILPLYCTFDKGAQYPEGTFICTEENLKTP